MADVPLLELEEYRVFGMLWPKRLQIFEDRIETHSSELLREAVETTPYREVEGVTVGGEGWSISLLIQRRGRPILLRGVDEGAARRAKALIEEYASGEANDLPRTSSGIPSSSAAGSDLIRKLADLRDAGILSPEEFEAKKRAVEERDR
ncbi:MAG: SHOCT domain-containing protein [Actinomycetota bacterium]|nr:SHOCT domain-containing protein [Actinomycetota bacterium]